MIQFLHETSKDMLAVQFLAGKWTTPKVRALVVHAPREEAVVPSGDPLQHQHVLPDGRLLRIDAAPPTEGVPQRVFITVEAPPSPPDARMLLLPVTHTEFALVRRALASAAANAGELDALVLGHALEDRMGPSDPVKAPTVLTAADAVPSGAAPAQAKADAEMTDFLAGVVGVVDATGYEQEKLLQANRRRVPARTWQDNYRGYVETIGDLDGRPVAVKLMTAEIDSHKILFLQAVSAVVDGEMISQWLKAALPPSAMRADGRINRTDAMNFQTLFQHVPAATAPQSA